MGSQNCIFESYGDDGIWETPLKRILDCAAKCAQCQFVIAAIDTYAPGWIIQNRSEGWTEFYTPINAFVLHEVSSKKKSGKFHILLEPNDDHFYNKYKTTSSLDRLFGLTLDISPDARLEAAFARARAWLEHCVTNDDACRPASSGRLPRRLLRVGPRGSSIIYLVNTSEDTKEYARFACLSYRWGADPEEIVRTTSANMAEHAKGIEVHKLPKTVIDAVIVCRELCIPYLWVDALCIIQRRADMAKDGVAAQDWLEEGSRMDDIYGLSHLTIYAEAATTCKESFLGAQIRGSEAYQRRVVNVRAPNGQAAFVREGGMSQYQSNEKSEMSQRGWCYQESLLPNRRLRFYRSEMVWECNCRKTCECGHVLGLTHLQHLRGQRGIASPVFKGGPLADLKPLGRQEQRSSKSMLPFRHTKEWFEIITDYSKRALFQPESNKLMAISGVAKIFLEASESGKACKDEYLAGLWRSTLLDSLPWHASGSNKYRRLDGGVPTWSWASLDGSVVFRPSGSLAGDIHGNSIAPRHYDAEVVDIKISLVSPDIPTGNVTAGQLGLKGPLLPVQVAVVSDQTGAQWYQERGRMEMPERFPIILARTSRLASSVVVLDADNVEGILDLSHGGKNTACWIHDKCSCQGTVSCFDDASGFFALCLYGTNESGQMKNRQVVFLLLKKRSTGDYERAGVGFSGPTATESYWRPGVQGTEFAIFQGGEEKVAVTIV
ncbi:hypothetical protein ACJZ2D_004620 [Fusarium nematophilum]